MLQTRNFIRAIMLHRDVFWSASRDGHDGSGQVRICSMEMGDVPH